MFPAVIINHMRTTLNLDDDALKTLKIYAKGRRLALGKAASELVRRGVDAPLRTRTVNGMQVVVLPRGTPKVSSETVKRLLEDEI
jgi:hypothetical protein